MYQPQLVFCDFHIAELSIYSNPCICQSRRFQRFTDPQTLTEKHLVSPISHVRSTDLSLIQNVSLRENLKKGLSHIPLETSWFNEVISEIISEWYQLCERFSIPEE